MQKVKPQYCNGIEYVQISRLPFGQAYSFMKWVPVSGYVKISKNEQLLDDCVHYDDYDYWFDNFYSSGVEENFEFEMIF